MLQKTDTNLTEIVQTIVILLVVAFFISVTGEPIQAQSEPAVVDKNFSVYVNVISTDNDRCTSGARNRVKIRQNYPKTAKENFSLEKK